METYRDLGIIMTSDLSWSEQYYYYYYYYYNALQHKTETGGQT